MFCEFTWDYKYRPGFLAIAAELLLIGDYEDEESLLSSFKRNFERFKGFFRDYFFLCYFVGEEIV